MPRPPKYKSPEERAEAIKAQKARSAQKRRREARNLDLFASLHGENQNTAKLTVEQVEEIRRLKEIEGWTNLTLARKFGVSERQISAIVRGENWKQ
jgi:transcriptional regulator with XRE-family HTH domain